jgi:hypothetical protein
MANANSRTFEQHGVAVECTASDRFVRFEYIGSAQGLLACGAVEPGMTDASRPGRLRLDSNGDRFWRAKIGPDRFRILRMITSTAVATGLPGAPSELITPMLAELHSAPDEIARDECEHFYYYAGTKEALIREGLLKASQLQFKPGRWEKCDRDQSGVIWIDRLRDGFYMVRRAERFVARPKIDNQSVWAALLLGRVEGDARKRDTHVGIKRRHALWISAGNVIVPQWAAMVGERLEAAL